MNECSPNDKVLVRRFVDHTAALRAVQQEIEPDWNEYKAVHAELDRLAQNSIADAHWTQYVC